MKVGEPVQKKFICEEEVQEIFLKKNSIAANRFFDMPLAGMPGRSENDRAGFYSDLIVIQHKMTGSFVNKKDVIKTELVWFGPKIEVGNLFNPANIEQQLSAVFIG